MKILVIKPDGSPVDVYEFDSYTLSAEPNENGDLTIYRSHINMLSPQPIASYAVGTWTKTKTLWD